MLPNLPDLQILPLAALLLHEDHDRLRTQSLMERLRAEGILRNPPLVAPLRDGSERYLVLDGANRVTALWTMGMPNTLAQVIQPDDPNLRVMTWNHLVWGMKRGEFLAALSHVEGLHLESLAAVHLPENSAASASVETRLPDGKGYRLRLEADLTHQAARISAIVACYRQRAGYDRTDQANLADFKTIRRDLTALLIFPRFEIGALLDLAVHGRTLPSGITRFVVSPRALRVNYPLEELASAKPTAEKATALQGWIAERLKSKSVRYYAEATFLFDE